MCNYSAYDFQIFADFSGVSFDDLPTGFGTNGVQDVHAKPSSDACSTSSSVYRLSHTAWTHLYSHKEIHPTHT